MYILFNIKLMEVFWLFQGKKSFLQSCSEWCQKLKKIGCEKTVHSKRQTGEGREEVTRRSATGQGKNKADWHTCRVETRWHVRGAPPEGGGDHPRANALDVALGLGTRQWSGRARAPRRGRGNTLIEWRDPVTLPRVQEATRSRNPVGWDLAALFAQLGRDLMAGRELRDHQSVVVRSLHKKV